MADQKFDDQQKGEVLSEEDLDQVSGGASTRLGSGQKGMGLISSKRPGPRVMAARNSEDM